MSSVLSGYEGFPEDKFVGTDGLNRKWAGVRTAVLKRLIAERQENGGELDMLTNMLLERLSYLYARIRQKEELGAFGNDRTYKSAMNLLAEFMAEVRKYDSRDEMLDLMKADVVDIIVKGVKEAVHDLPQEDQRQVMSKVFTLVSSNAG